MSAKFAKIVAIPGIILGVLSSCKTIPILSDSSALTVQIPYLKNSSNECYFLDEFMPTPDAMITGRNGTLSLRYYSYKAASYKNWENTRINLSFYSHDSKCWSLFEEFYTSR